MKKLWIVLIILLLATTAYAGKDHGYLGVTIQTISYLGEGSKDNGIYIAGVSHDSGAEAAGLKQKDRIAAINGQTVDTMEDLELTMDATLPGDEVTVTVVRNHKERYVTVVLGEGPTSDNVSFGGGKYLLELLEPRPRLGAKLQTLSPQLAEFFDLERGVLVTGVSEEGPAARAGLRAGDIITEIGEATIRDTSDIHDALIGLVRGDSTDLTIQSRGRIEVLPIVFDDDDMVALPLKFDVKLRNRTVIVERDSTSAPGSLSIELAPVTEEMALQTQIEELEEQLEELRQRLEDK